MSLPNKLPTFSVSTPGEVSDNENAENTSAIELAPPPSGFSHRGICGEQVEENGGFSEPTSADIMPETPVSPFSSDGRVFSPASSTEANSAGRSEAVETGEMLNESQPTSGDLTEVPTIAYSNEMERKPHAIQDNAWEEIRLFLAKEEVSNTGKIEAASLVVNFPGQSEPWRNTSSGIEGLRAFLDMSDWSR